MREEAGYTLVELMLTLLVVGVMMALLLPSLTRLYQHAELDASSRDVAAQVRSIEMSAYSHGDVHELWFSNLKPEYTLWENGQYRGQTRLPDRVQYLNGYLDQSVSLLRFDASSASGSGTIRLSNRLREQATVRVNVTSGYVVYDGVQR